MKRLHASLALGREVGPAVLFGADIAGRHEAPAPVCGVRLARGFSEQEVPLA